jgi:Ca2+-binding RTX toxin-like protein
LNGTVFTYKTGAISLINLVGGNGNDYLHVDQLLAPFSIRTRFFPGEGDNAVVGGNEHDNFICGGSGDDSIFAGNGDDTIVGGTGNDTMVVGRGFKLIFGAKGDNTITTDHGRGYIFGGNGTNTITSAGDEYEIFGGPGDDILRGGEFDTLWGQGGHDTLVGGLQRKYTAFKGIAKLRRILFPTIPVV